MRQIKVSKNDFNIN